MQLVFLFPTRTSCLTCSRRPILSEICFWDFMLWFNSDWRDFSSAIVWFVEAIAALLSESTCLRSALLIIISRRDFMSNWVRIWIRRLSTANSCCSVFSWSSPTIAVHLASIKSSTSPGLGKCWGKSAESSFYDCKSPILVSRGSILSPTSSILSSMITIWFMISSSFSSSTYSFSFLVKFSFEVEPTNVENLFLDTFLKLSSPVIFVLKN